MKSIMTMLLMAVTWLAGQLAIAADGGMSERAVRLTMSTQGTDGHAVGFCHLTRKPMGDNQ